MFFGNQLFDLTKNTIPNIIKITDINSERMVIHIRNSKGRKDRNSILSEKLLLILRNYFKNR